MEKLNWNIPTIKASRISGSGGSRGGGGSANWNAVGQAIANVGSSVAAGMNLRRQNIKHEKEQQVRLLKERNETSQLLYDKVGMVKGSFSGFDSEFETSKNEYFYGLIDKYVEIKQAMDDPSSGIDLALARRAMSDINTQVDKYKEYAPKILTAAAQLKENLNVQFGKAGAIAGGVPTAQQQLLLNLVEGGNVRIMDDRGNLVLYDVNDKGDVENVFNIDEYMRATNGGTDPEKYFRTIADLTDEYKGAASLVGTPQQPNTTYYDFETTQSADGSQNIVNLAWKKDKNGVSVGKEAAIKNIAASGFNYITEDPKERQTMSDLWNDTIGVDSSGITGQDEPWNPKDETKRKYKVKGYVDDTTGEFVFDPDGDSTQVLKDVFGNELELTQSEFAKRWLAEESIHLNAPKETIISRSKADEESKKGSYYEIDAGVSQLKPLISTAYFKGNQATFQLVDEGDPSTWYYAPLLTVPGQTGVYAPSQKFKINVYKTDKDGNIKKDKKGNPLIDYTGLRSGMGSKRKSSQ